MHKGTMPQPAKVPKMATLLDEVTSLQEVADDISHAITEFNNRMLGSEIIDSKEDESQLLCGAVGDLECRLRQLGDTLRAIQGETYRTRTIG